MKLYRCKECGFAYKEKELAKECEDFCKKHHQCSLEITRHAVQSTKQD